MPNLPPKHKPRPSGAPVHKRDNDRQKMRFLNTGSVRWAAQRARVLERDMFNCRSCGKWGNQVDHIHNNAHEDVSDDQLQTLCHKCHSAKTMTELNKARLK